MHQGRRTDSRSVVIFSGAGISIDPPSCQPLGEMLTQWVIDSYTPAGTRERITEILDAGRFTNTFGAAKRLPRLEMILECAWWIIGDRAYELLARNLQHAEPNDLHALFAAHLAAGGAHVTVNLDGCIEDAYERATGRLPPRIVCQPRGNAALPALDGALTKLHGSFHRGDSLQEVGLLLHGIGCGFVPGIDRALRDLLSRKNLLVFVGYGGLDFIDVTPFFLALPAAGVDLRQLRVAWIEHRQHGRRDTILHDGRGILNALEQCGATIDYRADGLSTREHLREICDPALPLDAPPWPAHTWWETSAAAAVSEGERQLIAAQIWSAMGAGAEATRAATGARSFFRWPPPPDWAPAADGRYPNEIRVHKILMNGLRDQGRYRSAAEYGRTLLATTTVDFFTRFVLVTRMAGDLWFGGDHAAGVALFDELLTWIERALDPATSEARWQTHGVRYQIVETFIILFRMTAERESETAPDAAQAARLMALRDQMPALAESIGEYQFTTTLHAQTRQPGRPADAVRNTALVQLDSLIGVINELRRRVVAETDDVVRQAMLADLIAKCSALGDTPGLVKAALIGLCDALRPFRLRRALASLALATRAGPGLEVHWRSWLRTYIRAMRRGFADGRP